MGHHIQKQEQTTTTKISSTMSIQYFILFFAAVSALGEPLGRSKDGRKHLDARSSMRLARSVAEEEGGPGKQWLKAVGEMVEKIDSIGKQVEKLVNKTSR